MDWIKSQKLKAKRKRDNLIHNILVHLLTTLICAFLCSYGCCLPPLIPSAESFSLVLLPRWKSFLKDTKTQFLVVNLVAIILAGDSWFRRAARCSSSSPVADLYDEYVERSKRLRGISNGVEESNRNEEGTQDKGEPKLSRGINSKGMLVEEPTRSATENLHELKSDEGSKSDELPTEKEQTRNVQEDLRDPKPDEGGESNELLTRSASALKYLEDTKPDEGGKSDELQREELTKRVEEFITRVNRRRWLESSQGH